MCLTFPITAKIVTKGHFAFFLFLMTSYLHTDNVLAIKNAAETIFVLLKLKSLPLVANVKERGMKLV